MAIRIGRWDCVTCGTTGILGPETRCPHCGASRPANVRFYLPEDAEEVTEHTHIEEARSGADWICGHCQTQNKAAQSICKACGNERDESSEDVALQEREYSLDQTPRGSFARERTVHPLAQKVPKKTNPWFRGILFLGIGIAAALLFLRSFPRPIEVKAESFRWERSLQMLHNEQVSKEEWSTPPGAYNVQAFQAIREYRQVLRGYETRTRQVRVQVGTERYVCGQIDKGNGYFEDKYCNRPVYESRTENYQEPVYDQVPVYATKYRFNLMEWVAHEKNLLKSAGSNHSPQWPLPPKVADPKNWKEGERTETYFVSVRENDGDVHEEKVGAQFWSKLNEGSPLKAKRSLLFDVYYGLDEPEKGR
ncbi:MAG: hypothetical protein EAZ89_13725 [Bacteroidetes bacterium]|nr:MAG: hypothetical protein EAZ89_13725 [Bacteroidota bacterium]